MKPNSWPSSAPLWRDPHRPLDPPPAPWPPRWVHLALLTLTLLGATPDPTTLLKEQVAAWNRGDLVAFCADYADDATFVSPSGVTTGRAAVLERYQKKYGQDRSTMGTLSIEPFDVRSLAGGKVVSIAARWKVEWPKKPAAAGLTLIVFEDRGGRWVLVQDASM